MPLPSFLSSFGRLFRRGAATPGTITPLKQGAAPSEFGPSTTFVRPETAPLPWLALTLSAVALLCPAVFLRFYQQQFGFAPAIILFGQSAVLVAAAVLGLIVLLLGLLYSGTRPGWCARVLAVGMTAIAAAVGLIYAGAYLSNTIWGDTLTYGVAATFVTRMDAALQFLPLPARQKTVLLCGVVAGIVALVIAAFIFFIWVSRRVVSAVTRRLLEDDRKSLRRTIILAGGITGVAILACGLCVGLAKRHPSALYGEPISSFLELVPSSNLATLDNARLAAALDDRASRDAYPKHPTFQKKNVILILSDALRADRMGVYGYRRETTPFLSSLAAKGMLHRVDMALSTCSESFCGIASTLASRPFHQISIHNFKLHELLRGLGYRILFYLTGDHRSWSYLYDFYGKAIDELHDYKTMNAQNINDDRNVIEALQHLEPYKDQATFLYFFLMSTHVSGFRLPEYDRFKPSFVEGMRAMTFWNELAGTQRVDGHVTQMDPLRKADLEAVSNRYDNGVLQSDGMMERIFKTLSEKGYLSDSIVVILGDHGDGLGEHGHIGHTRFLFQEDIHIPLLIYDSDPARYRNHTFATQFDVAPTIVDSLGLPVPASWQGVSLLRPPRERFTIHQTRRGRNACFALIRDSERTITKYIRCGIDPGLRSEEFYDLAADPGELQNLVSTAPPALIERDRKELDRHFRIVVNGCKAMECQD